MVIQAVVPLSGDRPPVVPLGQQPPPPAPPPTLRLRSGQALGEGSTSLPPQGWGGLRGGGLAGKVGGFCGVQSNNYWSSTTNANNTDNAWHVNLNNGNVNNDDKTNTNYVWPVRGGE